MLELDSVRAGAGRLVSGELAEGDEVPVMAFGTEVSMRLRDTDQVFVLRLPKLLVDSEGQWRIAAGPELGGMLELFMAMGFHLSPRLLAFEHYPLPYFTGNFVDSCRVEAFAGEKPC